MRVHADTLPAPSSVRVYLDDVEFQNVREADSDEGWIDVIYHDGLPRPLPAGFTGARMDPEYPRVIVARCAGRVRVEQGDETGG